MSEQAAPFNLSYYDSCQEMTLLLIHGFPLSNAIWEPQIEDLADAARIVAPDMRGHGASEAVQGPYSIAMLADDCIGLLEAIGVEPPVVVAGHSMGGYVALDIARRYREWVGGLILVSTRAAADDDDGRRGRDAMIATATAEGPAAIAAAMAPRLMAPEATEIQSELVEAIEELIAETSVEGIVGALEAMKHRVDATPFLAKIDSPTLIIHGERDQLMPVAAATQMAAAIPDATLVVLPEAGHLPSLEAPAEFNTAVYNFLQSLRGEEDEE